MLLVRLVLIFSYNIDLDGAEFTFVHYIQQLLKGQPLYLDPESFPYSAIIYTPLNLYTVYGICKLFNVDYVFDVHTIFIIGRCVSFICVIGCLYFITKIVRFYTNKKWIIVYSIFVFLVIISGHMYAFRPDSMKMLFFILFFYFFLNYFFFKQKQQHFWWIILFANLAFLAKQDAIVYIFLILSINCCYQRNFKSFFILLATGICCVITIVLLQFVFGKHCLVNLFLFNLQAISDVTSSYNLLIFLINFLRLLPIYLLLIYFYSKIPKSNNEIVLKVIIVSSILANIISNLFLFRPGSYLNYTYEAVILLMFSLFLVLHLNPASNKIKTALLLYFLFYFLSNLIIKNYVFSYKNEITYRKEYAAFYTLRNNLLLIIKDQDCLFAPDLKLSIFLADKNIIFGQEYHLDRLIYANLGLKSTSKLTYNSSNKYDENFVNGKVQYILAVDKETERAIIKSAYPKYVLLTKINQLLLYKFNSNH